MGHEWMIDVHERLHRHQKVAVRRRISLLMT